MRRIIASGLGALFLLGSLVGGAAAHTAPPCNDADGDGSPSGREYAAHHIAALAHEQGLGSGGHIPGAHRGFSLCLGVHDAG